MKNIEFYPTIDNRMAINAGIRLNGNLSFFYTGSDQRNKELKYENFDSEYYLRDDIYGVWNPRDYNLHVRANLSIDDTDYLFGIGGVAASNSKIKVCLQWMCKKTNLRSIAISSAIIIEKGDIITNRLVSAIIPKRYLREKLEVNILFVSMDNGNTPKGEGYLHHKDGDILGELFSSIVYVEGKGSDFPMGRLHLGANYPLWKLEYSSEDPTQDEFDDNFVKLVFNEDHRDFDLLQLDDFQEPSALFREIFASAMCQILINIKISDYMDQTIRGEDLAEGSICSAMHYFIDTYGVDTTSIDRIIIDVRRSIATKI